MFVLFTNGEEIAFNILAGITLCAHRLQIVLNLQHEDATIQQSLYHLLAIYCNSLVVL